MTRLHTTYSVIEWSPDGSLVTKTRVAAPDARSRFRNELRVNRLLHAHQPPVPTPPLIEHDGGRRRLTFAAVPGAPVGPKYPDAMTDAQVDALVDLATRLRTYRPVRRWFRRCNSAVRLAHANRAGWLTNEQTAALVAVAGRVHTRLRFAHGDLTARNVMQGSDDLTLIDWEWAGLYPEGYELAFLWYSLVDTEAGRARVEAHVDSGEPAFLLSALLIQLLHLQNHIPAEFRPKHLATRDALVDRLLR